MRQQNKNLTWHKINTKKVCAKNSRRIDEIGTLLLSYLIGLSGGPAHLRFAPRTCRVQQETRDRADDDDDDDDAVLLFTNLRRRNALSVARRAAASDVVVTGSQRTRGSAGHPAIRTPRFAIASIYEHVV